jgi:hypothetical protein
MVDAFNNDVRETLDLFSIELGKEAVVPWKNSSPPAKRHQNIPVPIIIQEHARPLVQEPSLVSKFELQDSTKMIVNEAALAGDSNAEEKASDSKESSLDA